MNHFRSSISANNAGLSSSDINNLISIAREASLIGGRVLMENYGRLTSIKDKGRIGDLVTNADLAAEDVILKFLKENSPEIAIIAEESGSSNGNNLLNWCVDPLDGTTNFAHGYPFFATSIGLTWNQQPILGAIDIPYVKENYWAAPGHGAFCNNQLIKVSSCNELVNSLLVTGFAYDRVTQINNNYAEFCWLTHRTRGVRRGGAAAVDLAFVASGKLDGYWERGLAPWDLAAGIAIVDQAGGSISDYPYGEFELTKGRVLACSPGIEKVLKNELAQVKPLQGDAYGAPELQDIRS